MANKIIIKYSDSAGVVPTLLGGEIAINRRDKKLFYTDNNNAVQSFSLVATGSSAEVQQNLLIPTADVTININSSAIAVREFTLTTGRKLTISQGAIFRIL